MCGAVLCPPLPLVRAGGLWMVKRDTGCGTVLLTMKLLIALPIATAAALLLAGCNIAGPAYPEKNGRAYLERRGCSEDLISRVVSGGKLEPAEVRDLQASRSADVRHLVAANPSLDGVRIAIAIADRNDFVRSGAARNPKLSAHQIELLADDVSHTVYSALAGNPALSEQQLLRLREKRGLEDLWFAMNPDCPASIRAAIETSDDALAKRWLEITDERKRSGHYRQGGNGR